MATLAGPLEFVGIFQLERLYTNTVHFSQLRYNGRDEVYLIYNKNILYKYIYICDTRKVSYFGK